MPRFWSFFLLSVALLAGVAESGNILFFGPFVSKSMIITYTPILKELASHGHKVHPCWLDNYARPTVWPDRAIYRHLGNFGDNILGPITLIFGYFWKWVWIDHFSNENYYCILGDIW